MLITVNENDPRPIYAQLVTGIKEQVQTGQLKPGDALPSVRELSGVLGINLHTVHKAYQLLRDQGVVIFRLGRGARVAPLRATPDDPGQAAGSIRERLRETVIEAFHLGLTAQMVQRLLKEELERINTERKGK
jgi:GntR family transcriptional regulator